MATYVFLPLNGIADLVQSYTSQHTMHWNANMYYAPFLNNIDGRIDNNEADAAARTPGGPKTVIIFVKFLCRLDVFFYCT